MTRPTTARLLAQALDMPIEVTGEATKLALPLLGALRGKTASTLREHAEGQRRRYAASYDMSPLVLAGAFAALVMLANAELNCCSVESVGWAIGALRGWEVERKSRVATAEEVMDSLLRLSRP